MSKTKSQTNRSPEHDLHEISPFHLVEGQEAWDECARALQKHDQVAIDLEANSMYAYRERVCLIQSTIPGADYVIDPLEVDDLTALGDIIEDPSVEKIFHAAEYDLILMDRDYGWRLNNLFDTMWAARILGYSRFGLASLLEICYDVKLSKRHQKSNWCQRPLSESQLSYARLDTHYLLDLRDRLAAELHEQDRWEEAQEIFEEQTHVKAVSTEFDADGFWSINGVSEMRPEQQAVLKALFAFRDFEGQRRNLPVFKVIGERTLLELAEQLPTTTAALHDIHGMTRGQVNRYGNRLLGVIETAKDGPAPQPPKRTPRPPDSVLNRYDKLHTWRKKRARERGVESDVIIGRDVLWTLARENPQSREEIEALELLGPWRLRTYSDDLLAVLRRA